MKPFHMARKILLPAVLLALAIGLAWKQTELAASLPADRVEILADGGASYLVPARAALEQAGADGEAFVAALENDRLVLAEVTLFTAQQADAALTHAGITDVRVLDYSWGKELLRQLVTLRRMGMGTCRHCRTALVAGVRGAQETAVCRGGLAAFLLAGMAARPCGRTAGLGHCGTPLPIGGRFVGTLAVAGRNRFAGRADSCRQPV